MRRLLVVLGLLLAGVTGTFAAPSEPSKAAAPTEAQKLPGGVELPVRVRVGFRVLNVLKIEEVAGQGKLYVEVTQRWTDPRLVFDAVAAGVGRIDRVGKEADSYLEEIWTPGLAVDNQIGNSDSRTVAVSTYANGDLVLIERYEGNFRFRMNLDAFPFDRQDLTLSFSLPKYAKQEALLIATEADRQMSGIESVLAVVDWSAERLRFSNEETMGWNARSYSRLNVTMTLARLSERYLLRIFVPILAILAVAVFVLWSPALDENNKGTLIFTSLLALAALSFTFESSFPGSISLNTPIAQMISLGYLYLVVVLMFDAALSYGTKDPAGKYYDLSVAVRRQVRWALPAIMTLVCIGAAVRTLPI